MTKKDKKKEIIYPKLSPDQEVFSTFDTSRILEIKRERLRQWCKLKYIPEGSRVAWGQGYKTVWSRTSLYSIALFQKLVDAGLNRKAAAACIDFVEWEHVNSRPYALFKYNKPTKEPNFVPLRDLKSLRRLEDVEIMLFINLQQVQQDIDSKV